MTKWNSFLSLQINKFVYFVNHLNRRQLAILSTFFSLGFMLLLLVNLHLYPHLSKKETGIEILVEMQLEKESIAKEPAPEIAAAANLSSKSFESNQSYNTQSKATYSVSSPANGVSKNGLDGQGANSYEKKLKDLAYKKNQVIDSINAIKGENNNRPSNTRVYYSLFERHQIQLPIPVYTCKEAGKVVIDIKVNPEGEVLDTQVNTAQSTTTNGCLLENALNYAAKSSFNNTQGKMQWGTITYYFQAK